MFTLGPLAFMAPALLLGLIALPVLWILLRAVPPAPVRRRFPGVALLLGLTDAESQSDRTPWWLLLLRLAAVAAVIIGFAGPVLNPQAARPGTGPLLIIADGTWADARDWEARIDRIDALLIEAARTDRSTAVVTLTDPPVDGPQFQPATATAQGLPNLIHAAWEPDAAQLEAFADTLTGDFDTLWLSDGLARDSRAPLLAALEARGTVTVFQTPRSTLALRPARFEEGNILLSAARTPTGSALSVPVQAIGLDPSGAERVLASVDLAFAAGDAVAEVALSLPPELRNRVSRFAIAATLSAGAISLTDDALRRREVALIAGGGDAEGLDLLSPLYYLREALAPTADLIDGTIADVLLANPDVIVLADVATLSEAETEGVLSWVEGGGLLLRFAGPRLAASDTGRMAEDPLLPVRLRAGGRSVGGTLSWGEPKALAPFADTSPFFGLIVPDDVTVSSQVVAQPDPTLAERSIAELADGTPLVTRRIIGQGQVVLMHVTANAEWSTLPLSGLFVQMLERLAVSSRTATTEETALDGTTWLPQAQLDAFGTLTDATSEAGIAGEVLAAGTIGPDLPPGLYASEDASIAVNVAGPDTVLTTAQWPAGITVEGVETAAETPLKGWLLTAALALLAIDVLASLAVGGRLRGPRADVAAALLVALLLGLSPQPVAAQTGSPAADDFALAATSAVVLAYVATGEAATDEVSEAGLRGLSDVLFRRTAIEPAAPMGIDLDTDELAFFPFIYWPVVANAPLPSREAYAKLNRYLASGGMILFDTRDADTARFGSGSPEGRQLQAIARTLDIPPLEPIPQDHVLTRTFYLLQDFPGRTDSRDVWVEASAVDAEQADGMPFRNLNDGVTPVVIGGNDWARAWATGQNGAPLFPVGRGQAGEIQREYAYRFGVNLIMHVLTGNYKSDQVHVPDLLERLGQ
ncbi:N-terminal double-transmembrane domain-containing protein [Loktanella fryxellensis]|uniref:N-terminal double-transmembrane domain-containing protein n=1 Tax=Loktanella fryxellensis TaxID=245187 RepID=A0A1H8CSK3_9RHOB|nr:DUF4159 domain-containing protein [Loktanella fryxellensis]SEM97960.1 N-terminal double-transmembrane domain-containing protein [Loktanella fryxellensis]